MKKEPNPPKSRFNIVLFLVVFWLVMGVMDFIRSRSSNQVPYSQFLTLLESKQIVSVTIQGDQIEGVRLGPLPPLQKNFVTIKMDDPTLIQKLAQSGVRFESMSENTLGKTILSWLLPFFFMFGFWWFIMGRFAGGAQGQFMALGKSKARVYVEHDIQTKFSDIAGVDEAKSDLEEVVRFLKEPAKYGRLGGRMPKGVLLVGPPGTGKTLLARAVAGEANVAFFSINGSEFVEMFVGLGAARVRDLFVQARSHAPCIIFIDELDALGKSRGLSGLRES